MSIHSFNSTDSSACFIRLLRMSLRMFPDPLSLRGMTPPSEKTESDICNPVYLRTPAPLSIYPPIRPTKKFSLNFRAIVRRSVVQVSGRGISL